MDSARPQPRTRKPQERVRVNTDRILDGAVRILASEGWRRFNYLNVSNESGLNRRSINDRYDDLNAMAVAVWQLRCAPAIAAAIDSLLDSEAERDREGLYSALMNFQEPSAELQASAELLVQSQFIPSLRKSVESTIGVEVSELLTNPNESQFELARKAYLLIAGLGLLMSHRMLDLDEIELGTHVDRLYRALEANFTPTLPVAGDRPDPTTLYAFDTGDPVLDMLMEATSKLISQYGFEDSSLDEIAAAAGFTKGAIFARYNSKLALVKDTIKKAVANSSASNNTFMQLMSEKYGQGVGEALNIRMVTGPDFAWRRRFSLEELRISWHYESVRESLTKGFEGICEAISTAENLPNDVHLKTALYAAMSIGNGTLLLPLLCDQVHELPFEVMTVPVDREMNG